MLTDSYQRTYDFHDGSHYQPDAGPMSVSELFAGSTKRADQGPAVCWKATQSTKYVDPTFAGLRADFERAGFTDRLFYHWLSSTTDPVAQADHYLRTISFWKPGDRVMLDAEEGGITEPGTVAWLERVESVTHEPSSVYCGLYVAGGSIWRSSRVRNSKYGPRSMHLAAYVTRESLLSRMRALGVIDLPMHFWQFSSNGPVRGITGRADMNNICDWSMIRRSSHNPPATEQPPIIITEGDDMSALPIITNAEQLFDTAPNLGKFVIMDDGTIRHLTPREWNARILASGKDSNHIFNQGMPWSNAEIEEAGVWAPPSSGGTVVVAPKEFDVSLVLDLNGEKATGKATAV